METVKKSRIILLVAFLLMVNFFTVPTPTYAANVNTNAVDQMDATRGQFSLDVKDTSVLAGGEVAGLVANLFSDTLFSFQKTLTVFTIRAYEQMAGGGDDDQIGIFERLLDSKAMGIFRGLFDLKSVTGIVSLAIAIAIISALFALLRMNISDVVGKLAKFFIIFILAMVVIGHGATVFKSMNNVVKGASNDITTSLSQMDLSGHGAKYNSIEDVLWDVGVVTPWKILQFGSMERANSSASGWGTPPNSLAPELVNALREKGQTNANEAFKNMPRNTLAGAYVRDSADTSSGFRKEVADKAWKTSKKISENEEEVSGEYSIGAFSPTAEMQLVVLGNTFLIFLLVVIVLLVTMAISIVLLAVKIFAFIVFFVGPIILIFAWLSPEGMEIVKRWVLFLGVILLGSLVCQILLTIYVLIVGAILGSSNVSSIDALFSTLLILIAMIVAIRYGGKPLLRIIMPKTSRRAMTELRQYQMVNAMNGEKSSKAATIAKAATGDIRSMRKLMRGDIDKNGNKSNATDTTFKPADNLNKNIETDKNKEKDKKAANEAIDRQRNADNLGETHTGAKRRPEGQRDINAGAAEQVRRDKEQSAEKKSVTQQNASQRGMDAGRTAQQRNAENQAQQSVQRSAQTQANTPQMRQHSQETQAVGQTITQQGAQASQRHNTQQTARAPQQQARPTNIQTSKTRQDSKIATTGIKREQKVHEKRTKITKTSGTRPRK